MTKLFLAFVAIIPLLLVPLVNAQSQTPKACISQELKNAISYATLLRSSGNSKDINQTFYDIGANVILNCVGK
jgi:hypothetical protein